MLCVRFGAAWERGTWSIERNELESAPALSGASANREPSGAFGLAARVGEGGADQRTGQRAERSVGAQKGHAGAPREEPSLGDGAVGGVENSCNLAIKMELAIRKR